MLLVYSVGQVFPLCGCPQTFISTVRLAVTQSPSFFGLVSALDYVFLNLLMLKHIVSTLSSAAWITPLHCISACDMSKGVITAQGSPCGRKSSAYALVCISSRDVNGWLLKHFDLHGP
jgi:hypothetical protein